jgi:hypothetical protein
MSIIESQSMADLLGAQSLLMNLCRPFVGGYFEPECVVVQPEAIPHPDDDLLVHHDHMTVVLQRHHGSPMRVRVIEEHLDGDTYTRKIALLPTGRDTVVEWGICRLDLRYIPEAAKQEILAKQLPLGAVLIKHDVHRRVKPRYFVRLPESSAVLKMFDAAENREPVYGRLGTIYCDGEPCIELLEIVVNTQKK